MTPKIKLSETYTDNLTLSSINPLSDFITQLTPGINIQENSRRTLLKLNYDLLGMYYKKESQLDHYYSQLDASGNAKLVDNLLYVDAAASIVQQPFSLATPFGGSIGNPTGNIINERTSKVSPYLTHRFGSFAAGQARFSHVTQSYSMGGPSTSGYGYLGGLSSSTNDTSSLALNSGTSFYRVPWGINLSDSNIHYTGLPETRIASYSANIGYLFTPKFKITLTGGYDDNNYVYVGQKPQQAFWSVGAGYAPTTHTKLSVSTGHRYFGSTRSLSLRHTARIATLQADYNQNVTSSAMQDYISPATTIDQLLKTQIPNDAARQQAVQAILSSLGSQALLYGQSVIA
ncbi:MAG TPA: TIGR03016 family PEP-CTERM system-associated outer membrane protein, partial [Burkholderiales bacterium]|nr:TIGR03016 family PEP-CTERM system-associated outer membrane protein [Burkholderiales bacterium]